MNYETFFILYKLKKIDLFVVQYYEDIGKPTPKVEVMNYLKDKQYTDAKDFAGECESVVMIAKGQSTNEDH